MNVLVTGGLGFVGSHLVDKLVEQGHVVLVLDDLSSESSSRDNINPCAITVINDIRHMNGTPLHWHLHYLLGNLVGDEDAKFDVVFHLAARARIQPSFENPTEYFDIDARGTSEVLEFARKDNAKVVYAGSSSAYGGPMLNPYAFAKFTGEQLCQLYSSVYGLSTVTARFFNVYGERQPTEGTYATVVGIFEKLTLDDVPLTVTGDGEQRRDFTHVSDIVDGFIALSDGTHGGEVFNLGTGKNYSINELAEMFGGDIEYLPSRPGEARTTLADITSTVITTNWTPKVVLEDYVAEWKDKNFT